jgi:hypothetical protein
MSEEVQAESFPGGTITAAPNEAAAQQQEAGKTFTQEELNRIVSERVARAKASFGDYDELKKRASEYDKIAEKSKTDLERAVDAARNEGAQTAMQKANARLVKAEARALAAANKFRDPSDAVAFLGDLSDVSVTDDGEVDAKKLSAALTELAKQKPYLLVEEKPTRPTGDAGQGPRAPGGPTNMNALLHGLATQRTS